MLAHADFLWVLRGNSIPWLFASLFKLSAILGELWLVGHRFSLWPRLHRASPLGLDYSSPIIMSPWSSYYLTCDGPFPGEVTFVASSMRTRGKGYFSLYGSMVTCCSGCSESGIHFTSKGVPRQSVQNNQSISEAVEPGLCPQMPWPQITLFNQLSRNSRRKSPMSPSGSVSSNISTGSST